MTNTNADTREMMGHSIEEEVLMPDEEQDHEFGVFHAANWDKEADLAEKHAQPIVEYRKARKEALQAVETLLEDGTTIKQKYLKDAAKKRKELHDLGMKLFPAMHDAELLIEEYGVLWTRILPVLKEDVLRKVKAEFRAKWRDLVRQHGPPELQMEKRILEEHIDIIENYNMQATVLSAHEMQKVALFVREKWCGEVTPFGGKSPVADAGMKRSRSTSPSRSPKVRRTSMGGGSASFLQEQQQHLEKEQEKLKAKREFEALVILNEFNDELVSDDRVTEHQKKMEKHLIFSPDKKKNIKEIENLKETTLALCKEDALLRYWGETLTALLANFSEDHETVEEMRKNAELQLGMKFTEDEKHKHEGHHDDHAGVDDDAPTPALGLKDKIEFAECHIAAAAEIASTSSLKAIRLGARYDQDVLSEIPAIVFNWVDPQGWKNRVNGQHQHGHIAQQLKHRIQEQSAAKRGKNKNALHDAVAHLHPAQGRHHQTPQHPRHHAEDGNQQASSFLLKQREQKLPKTTTIISQHPTERALEVDTNKVHLPQDVGAGTTSSTKEGNTTRTPVAVAQEYDDFASGKADACRDEDERTRSSRNGRQGMYLRGSRFNSVRTPLHTTTTSSNVAEVLGETNTTDENDSCSCVKDNCITSKINPLHFIFTFVFILRSLRWFLARGGSYFSYYFTPEDELARKKIRNKHTTFHPSYDGRRLHEQFASIDFLSDRNEQFGRQSVGDHERDGMMQAPRDEGEFANCSNQYDFGVD